jgi:glycosyltransferase involved in cell wall biosynthesis
LVPDLHIAAVSSTAEAVAVEGGLCGPGEATIVSNPLDPRDVVFDQPRSRDRITIALLGGSTERKGFDLVPAVVRGVADLGVQWQIYVRHAPTPENAAVWAQLEEMDPGVVDIVGRVADVRPAYAGADIVFVPSREESFCRIAAEAMMNGIPVVATDIPPLRNLLGDGAGLLFPVGDTVAAGEAIRSFAINPELRRQAGAMGKERSSAFLPDGVAAQMCALYGV